VVAPRIIWPHESLQLEHVAWQVPAQALPASVVKLGIGGAGS